MRDFRTLLNRLLYDPYRAVEANKNVRLGSCCKLGSDFRVRIDLPREDAALRIGNRCILSNHFIFDAPGGMVSVGDGVFINAGTQVISRSAIEIGNAVKIGWGCVIHDHDSHSLSYLDRIEDHNVALDGFPDLRAVATRDWSRVGTAPIKICDHAWLGFHVVVLKGVTIGEGSIVGARSVVTRDIPSWTVAAGNPARVVKEIPPELRRGVSPPR